MPECTATVSFISLSFVHLSLGVLFAGREMNSLFALCDSGHSDLKSGLSLICTWLCLCLGSVCTLNAVSVKLVVGAVHSAKFPHKYCACSLNLHL